MQQQNREHIKKLNETNKHLNGKFEEFQDKNDLNKYFTKNLDASTRAKVIKDIEELLATDTSIQLDKSLLDVHKFSGSTRHLSDINSDYEQTIKDRIMWYM